MSQQPAKWHNVYRNDEEKCVFVGKDGSSGLIRATDKASGKKFDWRSTDALARESGLSKKRVEEILEHYCNKKVVRQHSKDPEKWGYWELVGTEKEDPDVVAKDHEARIDKATNKKTPTPDKTGSGTIVPPGGQSNPGPTAPPVKALPIPTPCFPPTAPAPKKKTTTKAPTKTP